MGRRQRPRRCLRSNGEEWGRAVEVGAFFVRVSWARLARLSSPRRGQGVFCSSRLGAAFLLSSGWARLSSYPTRGPPFSNRPNSRCCFRLFRPPPEPGVLGGPAPALADTSAARPRRVRGRAAVEGLHADLLKARCGIGDFSRAVWRIMGAWEKRPKSRVCEDAHSTSGALSSLSRRAKTVLPIPRRRPGRDEDSAAWAIKLHMCEAD